MCWMLALRRRDKGEAVVRRWRKAFGLLQGGTDGLEGGEGGNEVKRAAIFLTLISVMVLMFAGVALAALIEGALIEGNDGPNTLVGTPKGDAIYGYGGADRIEGRGGGDALRLGGGSDEGYGEHGDDYISAVDWSEDDIFCGPDSDRARANPGDNVAEGCEKIIREGIRVD
jgi:Ca2+-binding RTX toxin-like protein